MPEACRDPALMRAHYAKLCGTGTPTAMARYDVPPIKPAKTHIPAHHQAAAPPWDDRLKFIEKQSEIISECARWKEYNSQLILNGGPELLELGAYYGKLQIIAVELEATCKQWLLNHSIKQVEYEQYRSKVGLLQKYKEANAKAVGNLYAAIEGNITLGSGANGLVLAGDGCVVALDPRTKQPLLHSLRVACKFANAADKECARNEMKVLKKIAQLQDCKDPKDEGAKYIIRQYYAVLLPVSGPEPLSLVSVQELGLGDLDDYLEAHFFGENGSMQEESVISILFPALLRAVEFLHSHNIVHLDLKFNNLILFTEQSGHLVVKVADFGHAAVPGEKAWAGTGGTIDPELLKIQQVSFAHDWYSVGAMLSSVILKIDSVTRHLNVWQEVGQPTGKEYQKMLGFVPKKDPQFSKRMYVATKVHKQFVKALEKKIQNQEASKSGWAYLGLDLLSNRSPKKLQELYAAAS